MFLFNKSFNAAVVVTTDQLDINSTPTMSNTDLAQTEFLSSSGVGTTESNGNSNSANLFNGLIGNTNGNTNQKGEVEIAPLGSITINFDTSVNTLGYDITGITSLFGWNTSAGGRANQGFSIELTFVDGSTATLLNNTTWEDNLSPTSYWTTVDFSNGGGVLESDTVTVNGTANTAAATSTVATGVASITFSGIQAANAGGVVVGREIDIFGVATIPEPSSMTLLSFFSLTLLAYRKRR